MVELDVVKIRLLTKVYKRCVLSQKQQGEIRITVANVPKILWQIGHFYSVLRRRTGTMYTTKASIIETCVGAFDYHQNWIAESNL